MRWHEREEGRREEGTRPLASGEEIAPDDGDAVGEVTAAEDRFELDSKYALDFRRFLQVRVDMLPDGSKSFQTRECKRERVGVDSAVDFRSIQQNGYFD